MTKPDYCSDNIATVSAIVFFFGFLFMLFGAIPAFNATLPVINTLRNDNLEWEFKGHQATLRAMNVPGNPIIGQATATQHGDKIQLKDTTGHTEFITREKLPYPDTPRFLYQWKHQGGDVTMVDMADVQRVKAQKAERTFQQDARERAHQDITHLSPEMKTLLTMIYRYQTRGY